MGPKAPRTASPLRAILVGAALLPVNAWWLVRVEMASSGSARGTTANGPYPSSLSLFANVICALALLTFANAAVKRFRPRWALAQAELLIIYVMLTIGTCLTSIDFLDVLVPMLGHAARYATPANNWDSLFVSSMPRWLRVADPAAVKGWYEGSSDPWSWAILRAWLPALAIWGAVAFALLGVMLCLNTLLRVQWTQSERLSYPVIELPMEMTDERTPFYRRPAMWAGFAVAGGISLLNGWSVLAPGVPSVPIKAVDIAPWFPNPPWNAMGWTPLAFYPFAIGLGFLLPADMLFSSWFFALAWRGERVLSAFYGLQQTRPNFPYVNEQSFGAYMAVAVLALWGARKHLATMALAAWHGRRGEDDPMSPRAALAGAALGFGALWAFFAVAGLPFWLAPVALLIYIAIAVACTRMRAELGPPAHDLHNGGPDAILTACLGTRMFSPQAMAALTWFYWFNRAYRSIAMPYQMEAFKMAERRGVAMRWMAAALVVAAVVGIASGLAMLYAMPFRLGAEARMASHVTYFGWEAHNRLAGWVASPRDTDVPAVGAIGVGALLTLLLQAGRMRFGWWPFHPLGFAISGSFSMSTLWLPMAIAWVCKVSVMRYGGLRLYRSAMPFFLGLMLGDYAFGCAWPMVGWLLDANTYSYYF